MYMLICNIKGLSNFDPQSAVAIQQVQLWSGQVQLKNLELDVPSPRVGAAGPGDRSLGNDIGLGKTISVKLAEFILYIYEMSGKTLYIYI